MSTNTEPRVNFPALQNASNYIYVSSDIKGAFDCDAFKAQYANLTGVIKCYDPPKSKGWSDKKKLAVGLGVGIPGGLLALSLLFFLLGKCNGRSKVNKQAKTQGHGVKYAPVKPEGNGVTSMVSFEHTLGHELGDRHDVNAGQEQHLAGAGSTEYQGVADRLKYKLPGFKQIAEPSEVTDHGLPHDRRSVVSDVSCLHTDH
jgi:hypothetical protein